MQPTLAVLLFIPLTVTSLLRGQVMPGDLAVVGASTSAFNIVSAAGVVTTYDTGGFQGSGLATSQAILHDPNHANEFLIGGFGFLGRATITGPGTVSYSVITNAIGTAAQLSWDDQGNVVVADHAAQQVRLVSPSGQVTDLSSGAQPWGTILNAGSYEPATGDVIVGGQGALYRLVHGTTTGVTIVTGLGGPVSGVAFDPCNGDILATVLPMLPYVMSRLVRVGSLGVVDEISPGTVFAPNCLDIDENGNFIVGDGPGPVFRVTPYSATPIAAAINNLVTGVAYFTGNTCLVGWSCQAPFGWLAMTTEPFTAGSPLVTKSFPHQPGVIGFAVLGLTPEVPPVQLDPLLGTTGCLLHVTPVLFETRVTDGMGNFVHTLLTNTAFAGCRVYVQHIVLEGPSFSSFSVTTGRSFQF